MDEMVELLHKPCTQFPVPDIFGVRRVVYESQEEILSLLRRSGLASATFDLNSEDHLASSMFSENDVGTTVSTPGATEVEGTTANDIDEHIPSPLDENPEDLVDEDPNFIPRTEIPEDVYVGHSEREIAAVSFIQKVYRITMARKHRLDKPGLEGGVHRYFREYLGTFQPSMGQGPTPRYKPWYLGPLPHILASLDAIQLLVSTKKAELKKMLSNIDHELLDEVGPALTHVK
jgi:hypothetical protein